MQPSNSAVDTSSFVGTSSSWVRSSCTHGELQSTAQHLDEQDQHSSELLCQARRLRRLPEAFSSLVAGVAVLARRRRRQRPVHARQRPFSGSHTLAVAFQVVSSCISLIDAPQTRSERVGMSSKRGPSRSGARVNAPAHNDEGSTQQQLTPERGAKPAPNPLTRRQQSDEDAARKRARLGSPSPPLPSVLVSLTLSLFRDVCAADRLTPCLCIDVHQAP